MVSSWSATSLCRAVFSFSNVLTLLLPKREPTLSAMLAAATVAAPFSFLVCISFFALLVLPVPFLSAVANPPLPL